MKQAIIDMGSNSMRLTVYEVEGRAFRALFKDKIMAGLAGYVENGVLSREGIARACGGLLEFRETIDALGIQNVAAFATASLRNIENTRETVEAVSDAFGGPVEVLSGEEEALFSYLGAMRELDVDSGSFVDIGGASTEVVTFSQGVCQKTASFPVGSLKLYRECVKKILPGEAALSRLEHTIAREVDADGRFAGERRSPLVCVGGTARAVLKLARSRFSLPAWSRTVSAAQFKVLCDFLCRGDREAVELILRLEPDRIHTLVPGMLILRHMLHLFDAEELVVSNYGVREGYLCQKVLGSSRSDSCIRKTGN